MNFSEFDVARRTRKGNFLNQIDQLIDWGTDRKSDRPALCARIGCRRPSGLSGIAAIQDAIGRNLAWRSQR